MADGLIYFGVDEYGRLAVLRTAGFAIAECKSLLQFRTSLCSRNSPGPVLIADDLDCPSATTLARATGSAPLILFRGKFRYCDETQFDLVVPASASPDTWVGEFAKLLEKAQGPTAHSETGSPAELTREPDAHPEPALPQQESAAKSGGAVKFRDMELHCMDCGRLFIFSAAEQEFFQSKGFKHIPKRCKRCRMTHSGKKNAHLPPEVEVNCAECGVRTTVPFKPAQGRPVLCRSCFQKHQG